MNPQQGPGMPDWGNPTPQYGAPQYGAPQYGAPQYGAGTPQYGAGAAPYPPFPVAQPSGGTAITAAVLSLLGGAGQLISAFSAIGTAALLATATSSVSGVLPGWYGAVLGVTSIAGFLLAAALLTGGGFLLARKSWAPLVIAIACGVTLVLGILSLIASNAIYDAVGGDHSGRGMSSFFSILGLVFPVATAVLALLPSTKAWINAKH